MDEARTPLWTSLYLRDLATRLPEQEFAYDIKRLGELARVIEAWDAQDSRRAAALHKAGLGEYIYA